MTEPTAPTVTPQRKRKIGAAFLMLFVLILLGGFGFCYYQLTQVNVALADAMADQQKKIADNQTQLASLASSMSELKANEEKSTNLSAQQEKLINDWQAAQKGDLIKWHVAEAQYLVKLANDHVQFTHDFTLALNLLERANQTLQNINSPALLTLREALASDMAALKAAPQVNVTDVYVRLSGINNQIDQLQIPATPLTANKQEKAVLPADTSWWKAGLTRSLETLQQVVVVRKYGESTLPLVLPEEKIFLYQNLHAQLEQAMWGALHYNADVYQTSLTRAINWVHQYFKQDAIAQNVLQDLTALQKIDVKPPVMNLGSTLTQFDAYLAQVKEAPTQTDAITETTKQ